MDRVVLDAELREKLGDLSTPFHIFDETGRVVLFVTPADSKSLYEGMDSGIPSEEIQRRIAAGGGRPLKAILADLAAKYGEASP
ncbi:hypothetical protein [Lacipirellula limnantheis]|uniref:Uncharacterized protein n=1 Tax=Lacipirellula limnantheis TaxID=2528024 RepID=A0A517TZG6_9BACT|nr:hypothetical protein [Lacipirellula limnantheis]QDT73761.1 hypothetical protein I41_29520 [Lacipirellula limnantheis]